MLLKNKTAVVTGCNKGIGKSIVEEFSKNGANIFACVRSLNEKFIENIDDLKNKFKVEIFPIELDLNNENTIKNAADKIIKNSKSIDILVNNAGTIQTSLFQMTPSKDIRNVFEVNFFLKLNLLN